MSGGGASRDARTVDRGPADGGRGRAAPVLALGALTSGAVADVLLVLTGETAWAAPGLVVPAAVLLVVHAVDARRPRRGAAGGPPEGTRR